MHFEHTLSSKLGYPHEMHAKAVDQCFRNDEKVKVLKFAGRL